MKSKRVWIAIIILILLAVVVADALVQSSKKIYIQGFFTNDQYDFFPARKIQKEFASYLGLGKKKKVCFEDSLFVQAGLAKGYYAVASESKIVAYTAAKELDFIVTTRENLEHYQKGFAMEDMRNLVDKSLEDFLVMGKDGKQEEKAVALEMTQSLFVKGQHPETPYFLFVPENSRRKEAVKIFIAWAFGQSK